MKPFNLFVYGTLSNRAVFRAVLGRQLVRRAQEADNVDSFYARRAVLDDYKKVSPDNTYLYAVPDPHGRIRGYLIGPLPGECMSALRRFEGKNYRRLRVRVQTKDGIETAVAFVGDVEQMQHSFGHQFRDPLKQEILLEAKIEAVLQEAQKEQLPTDAQLPRRAVGELHGRTIRDIVRRHFEAGGISDYAIRHSIKDTPLRDFTRITADPTAKALAPNYLVMVTRQVIFNEIEEQIRKEFRFELDQMQLGSEYYERTISSLAALRTLNGSAEWLHLLTGDCLNDLSFQKNHLIDFVARAVEAADSVYNSKRAKAQIDYVRRHMGRGYIPLGTELEFSNIGHGVIRDPKGQTMQERKYDSFLYFDDFGLDVLTWKLGGHIDDHHEKAPGRPRRGFFQLAPGSLSIEANLSKPVTDDPWLLNQLIHELRQFYQISPHSVHISLQLRSRQRPLRDRTLPLSMMKCLFAIAGDPQRDETGHWRINRLINDEIISTDPSPGMLFSDIARRHSSQADEEELVRADQDAGRYVQQFKFLRLAPELNYEPIAMALKGLQVRLRPGSFLKPRQYQDSPRHRKLFEQLTAWGGDPEPIPTGQVDSFLECIHEGLLSERRGRPAHSEAYIAWSLDQIRSMLEKFSVRVSE